MKRSNKRSKDETQCDNNKQSLEKKKKLSNENILRAELSKFRYYSTIHNLANRRQQEQIKLLAMNILALVVKMSEFKLNSFDYIRDN